MCCKDKESLKFFLQLFQNNNNFWNYTLKFMLINNEDLLHFIP